MAFQPDDRSMLEGYIKVARPLEEMFSVKNKVALVPGGSSGLGFDIALRLLQGGAKVVIASNSTVEEEAAISLFREQGFGDNVRFCRFEPEKRCNVCGKCFESPDVYLAGVE